MWKRHKLKKDICHDNFDARAEVGIPATIMDSKGLPLSISKLYIGNLPAGVSEDEIRQLFVNQNLSCTKIMVKRGGYAFVECPDQSWADRAIDQLNGLHFYGHILVVEPSIAFHSSIRQVCKPL